MITLATSVRSAGARLLHYGDVQRRWSIIETIALDAGLAELPAKGIRRG